MSDLDVAGYNICTGKITAKIANIGAIQEIAPTTLEGVNQRVTELVTTVDQEDEIIYSQLDDARQDRALLRVRVNMLYRDRPFHRRNALLMEEEARVSRQSEITELQAAERPAMDLQMPGATIGGQFIKFLDWIMSVDYYTVPTKYYEYISASMALGYFVL
ncbi:hypothetical protein Tco_0787196 [Tanacetum coccineum]